MSKARVLIVDDEKNILTSLTRALELEGYEALVAGSGELALKKLEREAVDVVLLDLMLPGMTGLELLERLRSERPGLPVVMMSAHGSIQTAIEATKLGARDWLEKPLHSPKVFLTIENTLRLHKLEREYVALKREVEKKYEMIGDSPALRRLKERIAVTAPTNGRVLITGEHGTGKELVARAIHALSRRSQAPFIQVNCAAIPNELIESELFGHERGSFTGATAARRGKFELADSGTLFLDEIGDMRLEVQAKLLRVLQENEFERVGASDTMRVDVRVVAATNKDLTREIERDRFREDLYYRLNVVPFHVPPLRERREDIGQLAEHFCQLACADNGRRKKLLTPAALEALQSHAWPGNVRELKNIVERLIILVNGDRIEETDVLGALSPASRETATAVATGDTALKDQLAAAERSFLLAALERQGWQIAKTARILQLERSHLYKKMKYYGISRDDSKK